MVHKNYNWMTQIMRETSGNVNDKVISEYSNVVKGIGVLTDCF